LSLTSLLQFQGGRQDVHAVSGYTLRLLKGTTLSVFSISSCSCDSSTNAWARYSLHIGLTTSWGLTPLEDQQLGGLIMWIPASLVYVIAGLALFAGWLREADLRSAKRERLELAP